MKIVIIHGTMGSPEGNWYLWLAGELETQLGKHDVEVVVPRMPTPENQNLDAWREAYFEQCGPITKDTFLIGHSCGAVLIMRLLEEAATPAAGTILVAPPYAVIGMPEIDVLNVTFLRDPFDWEAILSKAGKLTYVMAEDDQYVPQDQLKAIAAALKVTPILVPGGGHLNVETGFTTFPLLLDLVTSELR